VWSLELYASTQALANLQILLQTVAAATVVLAVDPAVFPAVKRMWLSGVISQCRIWTED